MKNVAVISVVAFIAAFSSPAVLGQMSGGSGTATGMKAGAPHQGNAMKISHNSMRARKHADARECLRFTSNLEVIKCAEKYLHR